MLTKFQLDKQKERLLKMKIEYEQLLHGKRNVTENDRREEGTGELSKYDNHPGDEATELFEREKEVTLNNQRREKLEDINQALQAIEEGNYGICEIGGEEISLERLEAMPETKRCIKHASVDMQVDRRAPEESVTNPAIKEVNKKEEVVFDREDAWNVVSEHGTSQTPADNPASNKGYEGEGESSEDYGKVDDVEDKPTANLEGEKTGITSDQKEHSDSSRNSYREDKNVKRG
ncbi:TraR/DksA C4-type zinc finger protein [Bacillus piscicola]|uniref:TraR/DksA C4-type zinc finger protein n=1 Tax=Bacillus piscicola TaxID=1632684 RepID=UPI001F09216D